MCEEIVEKDVLCVRRGFQNDPEGREGCPELWQLENVMCVMNIGSPLKDIPRNSS
jgi:hypothetical protein